MTAFATLCPVHLAAVLTYRSRTITRCERPDWDRSCVARLRFRDCAWRLGVSLLVFLVRFGCCLCRGFGPSWFVFLAGVAAGCACVLPRGARRWRPEADDTRP